jgi:alkylated DNA repair dioxygenase AlkB
VHLSPLVDLYTGLELCKVHPASSIRALSIKIPSDKLAVTSFYFPESLGGGEVHLIESIDGRQDEADEIFDAMQQGPCWSRNANHFQLPVYPREGITFHRHPLSCNTVKGVLLSQQFTCNYGAEYKHSVKMGTVHLDQAPRSVTRALKLISERTKKVIASTGNDDDFNEVYPVKYRETQKMNFHDDGEPGLGPTVSSLSLGVEAKMQFRLKEKYVKQQVEGGEIDAKGSITMANRILLTLTLRHGCIVIQHGRRLQEMIEHAVQPQMGGKQRGDNGVRIAVTARRIDKVSAEMQVQSKRRKTMIAQSVKKLPGGAGWASN